MQRIGVRYSMLHTSMIYFILIPSSSSGLQSVTTIRRVPAFERSLATSTTSSNYSFNNIIIKALLVGLSGSIKDKHSVNYFFASKASV